MATEVENAKQFRIDGEEYQDSKLVTFSRRFWDDPTKPRTILLRDCYSNLSKLVHAKLSNHSTGDVLIGGSTGIGKSIFGFLLLLEFVGEGKIVMYAHKTRKYIIVPKNVVREQLQALQTALRTIGHQPIAQYGVYDVSHPDTVSASLLEIPKLTYIQDLTEDIRARVTKVGLARRVIIASTSSRQLKGLNSLDGLLTLYMPLWTLEELSQVRVCDPIYSETPETRMLTRFDKYGGIIRFVLEFSELEIDRMADSAMEQRLTADIIIKIFEIRNYEDLPSPEFIGYFIHIVPQPCQEPHMDANLSLGTDELDQLSRNYRSFICRLATPQIERQLAEWYAKEATLFRDLNAPVNVPPEFKTWYENFAKACNDRLSLLLKNKNSRG